MIGMVHVQALPGTPFAKLPIRRIIDDAQRDAATLIKAGFDAILVENMHDIPYLNRNVGPEITSTMAVVASRIREMTPHPLGIQILAGANRDAIAAALASGADFIRAEGFVFAHIGDEGQMNSDAGELLRYRKTIGAEHVAILTDIKKKHSSHAITQDVSLAETCEAAEFFGADGLIITGTSTGKPADPFDVNAALTASSLPIVIGSGITPDNLPLFWEMADGFIVGSWIKDGGKWNNPVDSDRAHTLIKAAGHLRHP